MPTTEDAQIPETSVSFKFAFEANPLLTAAQVIIRNPLSAALLVHGHCAERGSHNDR